MNKILNINIGGLPFVIDIEAFDLLEDYLKAIDNHYSDSEGFEEITSDIEARLAELFQDALGKREILNEADVKKAISIMGVPEEFENASDYQESASTAGSKDYKTGRKLFRDVDNQKIGGVAAGLAAYFGIEDVVWVRLAFVVASVFLGFGTPLYIILWIVTPEALTSADRLAMRGETVDVKNMAKIIEDNITNIADTIGDTIDDIAQKKKK